MVDELAVTDEGLAEKGPDFERRIGQAAGTRNRPDPAAVEVADDDLLVGEVDKEGTAPASSSPKATRRPAGSDRVVVGPMGMVPGAEP